MNIMKNIKNNSEQIDKLKEDLNEAKKIIEQQKLTIIDLQNKLNSNNNIINNYQNIINQNNIELNNLRLQLNNISIKNNNTNTIGKNETVVVNFILSDKNANYAIAAEKNNIFAEIEEKLYKQYPQFRETNNFFIANGAPILRFKTIGQNNIMSGTPVTLLVPIKN